MKLYNQLSIKIYKDDVCICKYNYDEKTGIGEHEWLIPKADRPTEKIPITVSVVKATDYTERWKRCNRKSKWRYIQNYMASKR